MGENPWIADESACKLYIFDLTPLVSLGQHKPYYQVIGHVVNNVLALNCLVEDGQLKIHIADTCADVLRSLPYAHDKSATDIKLMCFKILKRIHRTDDDIVTHTRHVIRQNEIYIEVQKWTT